MWKCSKQGKMFDIVFCVQISFNFWKCDASGNPDSCEYVLKDYVNKEICKYMLMKNQGWTPFVEHFDKPVACPIKPVRRFFFVKYISPSSHFFFDFEDEDNISLILPQLLEKCKRSC